MSKKVKKLKPPDLTQCQAEKPNGCTVMTLGGRPGLVRCQAAPGWIVTEKKPGEDGQIGSMSLCDDCLEVFLKQMPDGYAEIKRIRADADA